MQPRAKTMAPSVQPAPAGVDISREATLLLVDDDPESLLDRLERFQDRHQPKSPAKP